MLNWFIKIFAGAGLLLIQVLATAQEGSRYKMPRLIPAKADSLFSWNKRTLLKQQLETLPPGKNQRLILQGSSIAAKQASLLLLARRWDKKVYRVNLSLVVSKYIGETEKNISAIFKYAEIKDNILFFDEADVLFGKRTTVKDSHDKYANQEVSYLMRQLESFEGIAVLSTNMKTQLDSALTRKFKYIIKTE
jgi:SpoVK/Ycf46/Vps4 family AAA+-type ATPase